LCWKKKNHTERKKYPQERANGEGSSKKEMGRGKIEVKREQQVKTKKIERRGLAFKEIKEIKNGILGNNKKRLFHSLRKKTRDA